MPENNIKSSQMQIRIFENSFSNKLNSNHELYKLKSAINWQNLDFWLYKNIEIKKESRGSVD